VVKVLEEHGPQAGQADCQDGALRAGQDLQRSHVAQLPCVALPSTRESAADAFVSRAKVGAVPSTLIAADDDDEQKSGKREYDISTKLGQDAVALLQTWSTALDSNLGGPQAAPWRQTAGNHGSEFGQQQYLKALFSAYKKKGTSADFALWEIAHFDLMVRHPAFDVIVHITDA